MTTSSCRHLHQGLGPGYDGPRSGRWLRAGFAKSARPATDSKPARLVPGLHRLDLRDWLLVDQDLLEHEVRLKQRALQSPVQRPQVLQAADKTTLGAQQEVLDLVIGHLLEHYPSCYSRAADGSIQLQTEEMNQPLSFHPGSFSSPLECAASMVQEDLVLMRWDDRAESYRMVASCVCFSFSDLIERVGMQHTICELHANVHGYAKDLARPVNRMLRGLKVANPVWRVNWSLAWSGDLMPTAERYPVGDVEAHQRRGSSSSSSTDFDGGSSTLDQPAAAAEAVLLDRLDSAGVGDSIFMKAEYQTLRRLPSHQDTLCPCLGDSAIWRQTRFRK